MREDGLLETLELGAGLEAELLDERPASIGVHVECLRLAAGAVEGEHQLRAEALAQRMRAHELAQLRHELGVTSSGEVGLDPRLESLEPYVLQPWQCVEYEALAGEIGERLATPEVERRPQDSGGVFGPLLAEQPAALLPKTLEPVEVELIRPERKPVSGRARLERVVRLEQLPQAGDVLLEGGRGVLGRVVAPKDVDQAIARDDGAPAEEKQGQQAPLLHAAEANLPVALPDLERAEDAVVESARQGSTVPRVSAA